MASDPVLKNLPSTQRQAIGVYLDLLKSLRKTKQPSIDFERIENPTLLEAVVEAQEGRVGWDVTDDTIDPLIHALYTCVYVAFHFDRHSEAISWVLRLGGFTSFNASAAGSAMGAKEGHRFLLDPTNLSSLETLLTADPSQGDFPRPLRYQPRMFEPFLEQWMQTSPSITPTNPNLDRALTWFKKDFVPVLVLRASDEALEEVVIFLPQALLVLSIFIGDEGIRVIEDIRSIADESEITLRATQVDVENIRQLFEMEPTETLEAYRIFEEVKQALIKQALGLAHATIKIQDPSNKLYDSLYNRKFFIINP
jgi:hypothetical protein